MEDSVEYLSYSKYKRLGGTLDQMSFNLLEYKSRKQIDQYTYNRLIDGIPDDIVDAIEYTMFNLIGLNNSVEQSSTKQSESIDGYSVSYGNTAESNNKIRNQITSMLSGLKKDGVPLTYAGGLNDNKQFHYPIS